MVSLLKRFWFATLKNEIVKDVAKLASGTLVGRAIAILTLPVLTRLFAPSDFRVLSLYVAIVSTLAVCACLRFEFAVPLAKSDEDAVNLLAVSLLIAIAISVITPIAFYLLFLGNFQRFDLEPLRPFVWLIGVGLLFEGLYAALQFWATRHRRFGVIARTRVTQAASGSAVSIFMGALSIAPVGLIIGNILNRGGGIISLGRDLITTDRKLLRSVSVAHAVRVARKYGEYPLISAPQAIINIAGAQVPIFLISLYGGDIGGHLYLATQLMYLPTTLLGGSIAQVYVSRAARERDEGRLAEFTVTILSRLTALGLGPLIFFALIAPHAVPLVFGPKWIETAPMVAWLVPWIAVQFVSSPISMVMLVAERQKAFLVLTLLGAVLRIVAVTVAFQYSISLLVPLFALSSAAYYFISTIVYLKVSGASLPHVLSALAPQLGWTIPWVAAGFVVNAGLSLI